jgi:ubiquinol-cytochrome c reductase cytochrome b subunit
MTTTKSTSERPETAHDTTLRALRTSLAAVFLALCVTGLLLMTAYNPSTATAWGSVAHIHTTINGGWLVRGIHYFASEAILVLAFLYVAALVVKHAYRGSGGGMWAISLAVVALVMGASLTGHLLPWDQAGYWGTVVRTNILARTPVVGPMLRQLVLGGTDPGNFTLARFYMLHVALLPLMLSPILLWLPIACGRFCCKGEADVQAPARTWPIARIMLTLVALVALAVHYGTDWNYLDAPADVTAADYPARPEWHTLFLFQWLKFFEGPTAEMIGSIVIPGLIAPAILLLPLTDVFFPNRKGRKIAVTFMLALALSIGGLTTASLLADRKPSQADVDQAKATKATGEALSPADEGVLRAAQFHEQQRRAAFASARAIELAGEQGVPPSGPLALLENDPMTRGPQLFAANCAACHRFNGHDGTGSVPGEPADSSDLGGFASQQWIRRLLVDPMNDHYFGLMKKPNGQPAHTKMDKWIKTFRAENVQDTIAANASLTAAAKYLESESLSPGRFAEIDAYTELTDLPSNDDERMLREGRLFFMQTCNECHTYNGENEGTTRAPEFFGYGSVDWLTLMIAEPDHKTRYRKSGKEPAQMPPFAGKLTEREISLIARWIHDSREIAP